MCKPRFWLTASALLAWSLLAACSRQPGSSEDPAAAARVEVATSADQGGAVSAAQVEAKPVPADVMSGTNWPPAQLGAGEAWIGCSADASETDNGQPLHSLEFFALVDALTPCRDAGVVRLRYVGKIDAGFTALVERVAAMATRMDIDTRLLDIDSAGGQVEDAMRAGDAIGAAHWAIQVGDQAVCHSACVLVLAAGDTRTIAGKVGIHRMVRIGSTATSRRELSQELRDVYAQMKDYLERNGAAVAVADLMMTVPNRQLRILGDGELAQFGLQGTNAAQDDLERIQLTRKCGDEFVRRKDAFAQAFDAECATPKQALEAMNDCGIALRERFGFPDAKCPSEGPLARYQ
ncbi:hypothetical protein ACFQZQ_14500 [Lysobacter koreensis]|uniref:Secreted protein n=1 Tax=Lysobacter koreensis TaxID=266122 RepID=A0ABW2YR41_9GAMM